MLYKIDMFGPKIDYHKAYGFLAFTLTFQNEVPTIWFTCCQLSFDTS